MPLAPATRVGPYEILSLLGAGGMGEVYKARDTRLDRLVALKFSQAQFSERFEREARAVAALNHPNICQLYDVGPNYLVMEYVDGAPVTPPDTPRKLLDLAVQIADGLAAAHAAGFIHRDLKPDNILLTREGRVKILDFGLAKQAARSSTPAELTQALTSTTPGTVVGTVAYMSPEQARGQDLDARSDQFSFGLILYELAAGKRAFPRTSAAETMTAIIREDPDPLPASLPAPLRWTIDRCLAKDRAGRYDSSRDLFQELRTLRDHLSEAAVPAAISPPAPSRRAWLLASLGILGLLAAATAGALWQRSRVPPAPAWSGLMLGGPRMAFGPRVSPDGRLVAFLAMLEQQTQLAIMKPDGGSWTLLTQQKGAGSIMNLSWAPDGTRLYFDRFWDKPRGVYAVPPLGGEPVLMLDNAAAPQALPDGSLVLLRSSTGSRDQIYHFWPDSGKLEPLPAFAAFWNISAPLRAFPDGREIVFFGTAGGDGKTSEPPRLYALDLASKRARRLAPGLTVNPEQVQSFALAPTADGQSVLVLGSREDTLQVLAVPRNGGKEAQVLLSFPATAAPWYLDMAPDGSIYLDQVSRPIALLRFPAAGGDPEQTPAPSINGSWGVLPLADGRFLFAAAQAGRPHILISQPGGQSRPFLQANEESVGPLTMVGRDQVAFLIGPESHREIAIASLREGRLLRRLAVSTSEIESLAASPDGATLYYCSGGYAWSVGAGGGQPRRLGEADYVTVDPAGRYLYAKQLGKDPIRLLRMPVSGGAAEIIPVPGDLRLTNQMLGPAAIDARNRILFEAASPNTWFYRAAILDLARGGTVSIPVRVEGDVLQPAWTADGRVVAIGMGFAGSLWRYRPAAR